MLQIDVEMPKRCAECFGYNDAVYGQCRVRNQWLGDSEGAWFATERPKWCPLHEVKEVEAEFEGGGKTWFYVCSECHSEIRQTDEYCRICGNKIHWDRMTKGGE